MNEKSRAFTLIELMVVISISALLIVGVSISLNGYYAREKIIQASSRAVSLIELARTYAITNQSPSGFTGLDYVSVTMTSSGKISAFPVNSLSGTGASYFSEFVSSSPIISSVLNFGDLNFAAGSGKLLGKNFASFTTYPLDSQKSVGITISSIETDLDSQQIIISPFGGIKNTYLDL